MLSYAKQWTNRLAVETTMVHNKETKNMFLAALSTVMPQTLPMTINYNLAL